MKGVWHERLQQKIKPKQKIDYEDGFLVDTQQKLTIELTGGLNVSKTRRSRSRERLSDRYKSRNTLVLMKSNVHHKP
jgi:hypothetical protein